MQHEGASWPAYLVGTVPWPMLELFQRRLAYEISGDPRQAAILFCDHPPGLSLGRSGSRAQIRLTDQALQSRGWSLRWLDHGGGVMLHTPGQVACYPQLSLDHLHLTPAEYVQTLAEVVLDLLNDYQLPGEVDPTSLLIRVRGRAMATIGVTIHRGVSSFGLVLNVSPDLELFREVHVGGDSQRMTSLQRECQHLRARVPTVRGQLLERLARRFGFESWTIFHHHPLFLPLGPHHARTAVA